MRDNVRYWYYELLRRGVPKWAISGVAFALGAIVFFGLLVLIGAYISVHPQWLIVLGIIGAVGFLFFMGAYVFGDALPDDARKRKDDLP
jgi:hypothetical protein